MSFLNLTSLTPTRSPPILKRYLFYLRPARFFYASLLFGISMLSFFFLTCFLIHSMLISKTYAKEIKGKPKIIDGDSLILSNHSIRLFGIDAIEKHQNCYYKKKAWPCGKIAKKTLKKLTRKKQVRCTLLYKDQYKRWVAKCFVNQKDLSRLMVQKGYALAYRRYSKDYVKDEKQAKSRKIGIWKGKFRHPKRYRR